MLKIGASSLIAFLVAQDKANDSKEMATLAAYRREVCLTSRILLGRASSH